MSPTEHVLPPKLGALQVCLDHLRDHVTVIYDVTIAFSDTVNDSGVRLEAPGMPGRLNHQNSRVCLIILKFVITT